MYMTNGNNTVIQETVLAILERNGDWMTFREIAKAIGMTPNQFMQIFGLLLFDDLEYKRLIDAQDRRRGILTKSSIYRIIKDTQIF